MRAVLPRERDEYRRRRLAAEMRFTASGRRHREISLLQRSLQFDVSDGLIKAAFEPGGAAPSTHSSLNDFASDAARWVFLGARPTPAAQHVGFLYGPVRTVGRKLSNAMGEKAFRIWYGRCFGSGAAFSQGEQ